MLFSRLRLVLHAGLLQFRRKFSDPIADYDCAAGTYDQQFTPCLGQRARFLIDRLPAGPGQRVVDVACGTGTLSVPLARLVGPRGRVLAVDLSEGMLEQCQAKALALNLAQIETIRADAVSYLKRLPPASVDGVSCAWGLCYLSHQEAFNQFRRVVRPGGFIALIENSRATLRDVFGTFHKVLLDLPGALVRSPPSIDLPPNAKYLAGHLRNRGFHICAQHNGELTLTLAAGKGVIEYLREGGVGAGYFNALDPSIVPEVERRFIAEWNRRVSSDRPPRVTHEFCAAIGVLS